MIGAASEATLIERLRAVQKDARAGRAPAPAAPAEADLRAAERLAIDYADAAELADKAATPSKRLKANQARNLEGASCAGHLSRARSRRPRSRSSIPVRARST